MIKEVDKLKFKSLGKATTKAVGESYQATQLSLDYHAQYSKALGLNTDAVKACDDWYAYCSDFGKAALGDIDTEKGNNYWFNAAYTALAKIGPTKQSLVDGRKALFADMALHAVINFAPSSNPAAAAEAADKQAAQSGRTLPKGTGAPNPSIDSLDPTADQPVEIPSGDEMSTGAKVGLVAAAGIALAWLVRRMA